MTHLTPTSRKPTRRAIFAITSLTMIAALAVVAGCRPNVPLIPGIRSDVRPLSTMQPVGAVITPARGETPLAETAYSST